MPGAQGQRGYPPGRRPAQPPSGSPPARRPKVRPPPPKKAWGEDVLLEFGRARKSTHYIMRYVLGLVLAVAGAYLLIFPSTLAFAAFAVPYISMGLIAVAVILLALSELRIASTSYAITRSRVIERTGVIRKKTNAVQIRMITGTKVNQGIIDRVLGVGTLELFVKTGEVTLDYINDPHKVEDYILRMQTGSAPARQPSPQPPAPPAAPPRAPPSYPGRY